MSKKMEGVLVAATSADLGAANLREKMTGKLAVEILSTCLIALEYLENKAQGSVNRDVDSQIVVRSKGENASGKDIAQSFKSQDKVGKTGKAVMRSLEFAKLVATSEQKLIENTAKPKAISTDVPAK